MFYDLEQEAFEREVGLRAITSRPTKKFKGLDAVLKAQEQLEHLAHKDETQASPGGTRKGPYFGAAPLGTRKFRPGDEDKEHLDFVPRIKPGQQAPESETFGEGVWLPQLHEVAAAFGLEVARSPLNASLLLALLCCLFVWLYVWKTRLGYELRVVGRSEPAAVYAGIDPQWHIVLVMTISGALAGMMATNELLGAQHRLLLGFTGGYGFVGIAVALMGRNHPLGVVVAALLFGALYQGGSELSFDMPAVNRDMVVVIQGLVILFAGALEHMFRPGLERLFARPAPAIG